MVIENSPDDGFVFFSARQHTEGEKRGVVINDKTVWQDDQLELFWKTNIHQGPWSPLVKWPEYVYWALKISPYISVSRGMRALST